jgi:lipid-A-disaccharide synthase
MRDAGCKLLRDMSDLAVMGLLPALAKLPQFLRLLGQVEQSLDKHRPDAVVLIDYPGFNWHVARKAKERGIPVFYYGLPQVWAWATWRVKKVARHVDHALCKLPFEEAWFRDRGCHATYVGHPYFDELAAQRLDTSFLEEQTRQPGQLLTILPGSRTQEVRANLPQLLEAAALVRREVRGVRVAVASYNERQATMARQMVAAGPVPSEVFVHRTPELIAAAQCCLACSGSVSLELLYHAKPSVIVYRVPWITWAVVRRLFRARYITLVNLMASDHPFCDSRAATPYEPGAPGHEQVLFPEYPTFENRAGDVAAHAIEWLQDEGERARLIGRLKELRDRVGIGGASARAADYIVRELTATRTVVLPSADSERPPLRRAS